MHVLVTGAAGFLGSHLTDRLLAEGHSVLGVDNFSTGNRENIAHLGGEARFRFEEWDICEPFDFGPVDYVFNFASPASPPEYLRLAIETLRVGSAGVENTLKSPTAMAQDFCMLPPRSATAIRWSIRNRRVTGAMSIRSALARSTTRPSVLPRRW